jgi:prepilin-type N-terminal cleavage/methylation domain-containing protein
MSIARRPGFTLIEMVVVLGILAVSTAVAVPAFLSWLRDDDLADATSRVGALFALARDSAIHSGVPVMVIIDSATSRVWIEALAAEAARDTAPEPTPARAGAPRLGGLVTMRTRRGADDVDSGESLDLPSSVRPELTRARARFVFAPSGAAYADTLVLRAPAGERVMTLSKWTGDVLIR